MTETLTYVIDDVLLVLDVYSMREATSANA